MKKVLKITALSASLLAMTSGAFAAVPAAKELNVYGASAEFNFWTEFARTFLTATEAAGGMGCASYQRGVDSTGKMGITKGISCTANQNADGKGNIIIRYTSSNSIEGIRAAANAGDIGNLDTCPGSAANKDDKRMQAAEPLTLNGAFPDGTDKYLAQSACDKVDVGASDVALESFVQESHGMSNGYLGTGSYLDVYLTDPTQGPPANTTFTEPPRQPIIVPFSFFANTGLSVDNITRQQALLLMSGSIAKWNMFGDNYPDKRVVLCMRHAGSGTHATLDMAVMRTDKSLATYEDASAFDALAPTPNVYFHTGSGGVMDCVNLNGNNANGLAIGYADSDALTSAVTDAGVETKTKANVKRMLFAGAGEGITAANKTAFGYSAIKKEIAWGMYEFWSAQWMYFNNDSDNNRRLLYLAFTDFAGNVNLDTCTAANKLGCYWLNKRNLTHTVPGITNPITLKKDDDTVVPAY